MTAVTTELLDGHMTWAQTFMKETWGGTQQVSRGTLYDVLDYPGFVAVVDGKPQGVATYRIYGDQCEIMMIHSAIEGVGAGSALMDRVEEAAREVKCTRLWLITTNDNIPAIRWYQRRGFSLVTVHVQAMKLSRKLKPDIPATGYDSIPIRDEIELEKQL
ncbi:MAG: GNAT family N-acetyltransferase [Chloroflexota bacterium]